MEDIHAAGTSKCNNSHHFEVNNNNNNNVKPKSPDNSIRKYIGLDYKQLQTVVASWGLPSNLKRKQLLAIIVAKQKKKDYMIPAILNEVDRERMEKKKCIKNLQGRMPCNRFYHKQKHLYHYQMQYQPQQNQTTNNMASFYGRKISAPSSQELTQQMLQESKLVDFIENNYYGNTYPNFQFDHMRLVKHLRNVDTLSQDVQKSYKSGTLMLDFINKHPIPSEIPRMKQITTNTTTKVFSQPSTPVLVYAMMKDLTKTIMSPKEYPCNFPITYIDPPFSSLNFTFGEQQDLQDADDLIFENLEASHDLNLDTILDYIMGAEEKDDCSSQNSLENLFAAETQHDTESAWKIYEMQLCYHSQIIAKHLYALHPLYSLPYNIKRIFSDTLNDFIYYCVRPTQTSPLPMFAKAMKAIPHSYEAKSIYTQKNCIYPSRQRYIPGVPGVPERCMLHPENNLIYGVPRLYFNARDAANSSQMMNNYLIHSNNQTDAMRTAFTIPQVHYNIMLPKNKAAVPPRSVNQSVDYAELKPRSRAQNEFDVEPTIPPLSVAEEMFAYNSLDDIGNINIRINENFKCIAQFEHDSYCVKAKLPCPFLFTQCCWYENLPQLAQHIRMMHPERVVSKKQAEYFINFVQLESIKNGVKIIQEYNNRMVHISLCNINSYIYITGQEVCENFDQHMDKMKILLLVKHQSGVRSWKGDLNPMYVPLSQLWRSENALIIPVQYLKLFPTKHFKLFVQIGL